MKFIVSLIAGVFLFSSSTLFARVGETLDQCIARYGRPITDVQWGTKTVFFMSDILIGVDFVDSKAVRITFVKRVNGQDAPLSDAEVAMLMNANGAGRKWVIVPLPRKSRDMAWLTDDGQVAARRNGYDGSLLIGVKGADEALDAKAAERLTGF